MARILVVDDDPDLLELIKLLVEGRREHEAVLCADGEDALTRARRDPPDLAIVDVMMPDMTGYEICRRLREHPETALMPILVLTARGQAVDREAALRAGADEHVPKPVSMATLLDHIDSLLKRRSKKDESSVVVIGSLKGGVGVTTLAANLGATMAQQGSGEVCLVDLCSSSGHAALHFGCRPEPDWTALLQGETVDLDRVEPLLLQPVPALHVLASPMVPLLEAELSRPATAALLETIRRRFQLVIVDAPSTMNGAASAAMEAPNDIWLVVCPDSASIQTTLGTLRALREPSAKLTLILNHVTTAHQISTNTVERVLNRRLKGIVPFDPEQAKALGRGMPLAITSPDSPLPRAVQELARGSLL